jgi:hypothetical protein
MSRPLPGTVDVEGREFIYIQVPTGGTFSRLVPDILASCPAAPLPRAGGVLEEKARLVLPDKTSLLAISFKGDLTGWRNKIVGYCNERGRKWAVVRDQVLAVSDGTEVPVSACEVEFEG